jgi:hypothetical protein
LWLWPAPTRLQWRTDLAVITSRSDDGRAATSSDGGDGNDGDDADDSSNEPLCGN